MLKGKEDLSNPENTEQYHHQQDVEIWKEHNEKKIFTY
jgi:hypothetical protein